MKTLLNAWRTQSAWMKQHPRLTATFTTAFLIIGVLVLLLPADDWRVIPLATGYLALLTVWSTTIWWQMRKAILLLLVCSFLLPFHSHASGQPTEQSGTGGGGCVAVAVALVVLVVGGVVTYKVVKFCQKKFPKKEPPKKTNAPPAQVTFAISGSVSEDMDAAALNFAELGSCFCNDQNVSDGAGGSGPSSDQTTTFTLTLRLDQSPEPGEVLLTPLEMTATRGEEAVQTWTEFAAQMRTIGVTVTGHGGDFSYSHNGQPVSAEQSPISWDPVRQLAKVSRASLAYYTVVVQRSPDLQNWTEVLRTEIEIGSTIQVQDTNPASQQFYRYSGVLSD